ncbi:TonB-dependent siderophore receptor [Marinospirillum sp.]|uniref:TonB-dependent siderophore receptor n=1 Tax=Marinospirillum sp. TaxID=2183934 RepID=UPI00286FBE1C|nr:TonB-dependent siderophore receptor [Marinospirillum sp.]MDR9467561.1 TonB-dependent siderophore receptor [Marinospirillum sp.]
MQFKKSDLFIALLAVMGTTGVQAEEAPETLDTLEIRGNSLSGERYLAPLPNSGTGLALDSMQTPQSQSVVTRQQIEDFNLNDLNGLLTLTPGVTVEKVETDRTYYTARGFDITNFQLDGVGVPSAYGNIMGDLDTVFYERVEVLRGANGLMSGSGNPSATVNLVRKRPTQEFAASASLLAGSWNQVRTEGDVSGRLTESGKVRGRLVMALENSDSYLDRYGKQRGAVYGVVEADLAPDLLLTLGHNEQADETDSPLWGALPMQYTDGSSTNYDVSTSTSADWAYWNNTSRSSFLELQNTLSNGWTLLGRLTRNETDSDSKLFYVYGTPDRNTGLGLKAYPSRYDMTTEDIIGDLQLNGDFVVNGYQQEFMAGLQWYRSEVWDKSLYGQGIGTNLGTKEAFDGSYPEPAFDASEDGSEWTTSQTSLFAATRLTLSEPLSVIAGLRLTQLDTEGSTYGTSKETEYDLVPVPYAGVVYQLTPELSLYSSYTEIFDPQTEEDLSGDFLDPVQGRTFEGGVKTLFAEGQAQASLAIFHTRQDNVAEKVGTRPGGTAGVDDYYQGVDGMTSEGVELDLAGEVLSGLHTSAGFTHWIIKDAEGEDSREEIPRNQLKLAANYQVPHLPKLRVGGSVRWQSKVSSSVAEQEAYALADLMAAYRFNEQFQVSLNLNNITDEKYINSVMWDQAYYGAPASAQLKLDWQY